MLDPSASAALRASARLSDLDPALPAATERALAAREGPRRRGIVDPGLAVSLASLLLGLAQFAWTVRQEQKRKVETEDLREVLVRRMRVRIQEAGADNLLSADRCDRVLEVVAEEILSLEGAP